MVLEHAVLHVIAGQEDAFLEAMAEAKMLIARTEGFLGLEVSQCIEDPSTFLLLVEWETIEDHMENFREGPDFPAWRAALHHFYDPAPVVQHFTTVEVA
jgi:heme-degrading monooxygenase HmoA